MIGPISPCLWVNGDAEDAANTYVSIFKNSRIVNIDRFSDGGQDGGHQVVVVEFELNGQPFQVFNGNPGFPFTEAVSFSILCEDQDEVDYYWDALLQGGEPSQCGWLKDRYGMSWQVVPKALIDLMRDDDREAAGRVMQRMLQMVKLDVAELQAAYNGVAV